jgi:endonuclease-3 related protein
MKAGNRGPQTGPLVVIFENLLDHFGPLHWWPATTPFEVVVGAILTQNTAWRNVEIAMAALRQAGRLTPEGIRSLSRPRLEALIRPSGFFRQKAEYLHTFVAGLEHQQKGDLDRWLAGDLDRVRQDLLQLRGIGPETADSILLYAGGRASFVVDAYTRRLFTRLGLLRGKESYEAIRTLFMANLPHDSNLFNEYHALIVEACKAFCRKRTPRCPPCPLLPCCRYGQVAVPD